MAKLTVKRFADRAAAERHYLGRIDTAAENARAEIITAKPGQALTYEAKYREALAGGGPFLEAEAAMLGVSVTDVVQSVLTARAKWEVAGITIERARLQAKRAIRKADTAAEMHRIVDTLTF